MVGEDSSEFVATSEALLSSLLEFISVAFFSLPIRSWTDMELLHPTLPLGLMLLREDLVRRTLRLSLLNKDDVEFERFGDGGSKIGL